MLFWATSHLGPHLPYKGPGVTGTVAVFSWEPHREAVPYLADGWCLGEAPVPWAAGQWVTSHLWVSHDSLAVRMEGLQAHGTLLLRIQHDQVGCHSCHVHMWNLGTCGVTSASSCLPVPPSWRSAAVFNFCQRGHPLGGC